jgi:hypothetical protein
MLSVVAPKDLFLTIIVWTGVPYLLKASLTNALIPFGIKHPLIQNDCKTVVSSFVYINTC